MSAATNYTVNKILVDTILRGQTSPAIPSTMYYGLFVASQGYWAANTSYSSGQTVIPTGFNPPRVYACTTPGTSSSSAPTWPVTAGGTVTDGSVVWTEQTIAMLNGTFTEATYSGYARQAYASTLANWAGTQGSGTTTASTGSALTGSTSNNVQVSFGAPTSNQAGVVVGAFLADASTSGNIWFSSLLTNPKTVNNGDAAPQFPTSTFVLTWS